MNQGLTRNLNALTRREATIVWVTWPELVQQMRLELQPGLVCLDGKRAQSSILRPPTLEIPMKLYASAFSIFPFPFQLMGLEGNLIAL